MEELATAPPPRRRHRRKASDAAAAAVAAQAASSYGDVFGGPPRFAPPPAFGAGAGSAPADYSEVFGGVSASCSIPYLDLPPAVADGVGAGAGGYGEIFGHFDFGDFAAPYEEMLPGAECLAEEIASPSGSSRSSIRKESGELDAEPSILCQQYPNAGCDQHFDEEQFYPVSFPPDGEQRFSMSYNKATRGRLDDVVEMSTCIVEPSISYVVDSCNLSNDSEMDNIPVTDSGTHANGVKEKMSPQNAAAVGLKSANSKSEVDQQQHIPTFPTISQNICEDESFNKRSNNHSLSSEEAPSPEKMSPQNAAAVDLKSATCASVVEQHHIPTCPPISQNICEHESFNKRSNNHSVSSEEASSPEKMSPQNAAAVDLKSASCASVVEQQHIPTCLPISENICEDESFNKMSSNHSVSSEEAPSPEKMSPQNAAAVNLKSANCASVFDPRQHIPTCLPISENICEDESFNKRSSIHSVSSEEAPSPDYPFLRVSDISLPAAPIKVQPPPMPSSKLLNKNGNKEHGDSDVNPNSAAAAAAMKEAMEFAEARLKAAKDLMERKGGSFKFRKKPAHHRSTKSTEIKECKAPEEVHLFEENLNMRRLTKEDNHNSDIASLDKSRDGGALKSVQCDHDKKGIISPGKPEEMMQKGSELEQLGNWTSDAEFYELVSNDQRCRPNEAACQGNNDLMTNSFTKLDQSDKEKEEGFAGEPRRFRKLWNSSNTAVLRMEHVNQGKDSIASMEVEQKAPRFSEVPFCDERVTFQDPTKGDNILMMNSSAKLDQSDKEKERGSVVEPKRSRKLWGSNNATGIRMELVNQGKYGIPSMEAEQKALRSAEVPFCDARVAYQEPSKGDNSPMTANLDQSDKGNAGGFAAEPKRSRKLWSSNNTTGIMMEPVNQGKDRTASVGVEQKAPRSPEIPFCDERVAYQEPIDGVGNSEGHSNDGQFEISCMNSSPAHTDPEMSSSFLEPCLSGGHANGNKNHSDFTAQETPLVGNSNQSNNNKEGLEVPCTDELPCTSARSQVLQELPNAPNTDKIKEGLVKISKLEDSAKPYEIFDEACLQNGNENEVTSESLIHEEMTKYGIEEKADAHEYFQEEDVDQAYGSPEEEGYLTSGSAIANESEYEEAEVDAFVGESTLGERNVRTCGTCDEDPYQFQESQGSWGPQGLENRMERVENIVSHGEEKEAHKSLLENVDKILVEEVLNHDGKEGPKSMETGVYGRTGGVCEEVNVRSDRDDDQFDTVNEFVTDDGTDYAMKMGTLSSNLHASLSEACTSMNHLSQNTEPVSAEKADILKNHEVDCQEADRKFPTENFTTLEEGQNTGSKLEEDTASETVLKSRDENLDVQRTKARNDVKETGEIEKEVLTRLDEEKEKVHELGKEKEQDKERRRRELEEEKEREMERAKDRLAVQRATREAHERAFAEVRAKAERIALERITSARQRASAEAHEKEDKTTSQAALEKASKEARMKAERAAVERATAEARERAIEKAKAAADAKERMERFRGSFKDSFKDDQHEAQFQKMASNNHRKSKDIEVVEVEPALRHKAKSERHQRTAERAAKALAEKNMRDMLAQREQAEKHRLAEFLDPEVKRWSNGKEGNLRALLSTLQYILGSDSGWQPVPLTELITAAGVKKAYRKATLCVHPDKVQQRGATIRQKYICEKVFDLLKEAWNKYNSEER
ncbi:unnamed protein product [Urochloa decumbens]|uniref:J domain-containing protein n=1 Tax=Urochloa decumbens TaxID=240449 RepID=A0ABC8Z9V3_9POAL